MGIYVCKSVTDVIEKIFGHCGKLLKAGKYLAMWARRWPSTRDASQTAPDELIARHAHDRAFRMERVYAWRGGKDLTFTWLERTYVQRDSDLTYINYEPFLAKLRDDPRFAAMLDKMKLAR